MNENEINLAIEDTKYSTRQAVNIYREDQRLCLSIWFSNFYKKPYEIIFLEWLGRTSRYAIIYIKELYLSIVCEFNISNATTGSEYVVRVKYDNNRDLLMTC